MKNKIIVVIGIIAISLIIINMSASYSKLSKTVNSKNSIVLKAKQINAVEYIKGLAGKEPSTCTTDVIGNTGLAYDCTSDNNLRYVGANPNNYVTFNNELWRIIGVMNNIDDGNGNKKARVKLIRNDFLYTKIAFDTNDMNDYSLSSLKSNFNGEYYNNLSNSVKNMVDSTVWNLGGELTNNSINVVQFYKSERGQNVYKNHQTKWIGKVGLMYPSDYGYATSGSSQINRENCLTFDLINYSSYSDCYHNNWLYDSTNVQWTITPRYDTENGVYVIFGNTGCVYNAHTASYTYNSFGSRDARPSVYLNANVKITIGSGTSIDPYKLSI